MKRKVSFYFIILFIFIGIGVLSNASCSLGIKVWVVPGSTADNLVFGFSDTRSNGENISDLSIRIYSCETWKKKPINGHPDDQLAYWIASVPDKLSSLSTNRFTYGKEEFGLKNIVAPKPLSAPGCYLLLGYGKDKQGYLRAMEMSFNVEPNGTVQKK